MKRPLVANKTVLEMGFEWSADRPAWQRDALRRIIAHGRLSQDDVAAHDPSGGRNAASPAPSDALQDIQVLKDWVASLRTRHKHIV